VVIIGAGPAGLGAAHQLMKIGAEVSLYGAFLDIFSHNFFTCRSKILNFLSVQCCCLVNTMNFW